MFKSYVLPWYNQGCIITEKTGVAETPLFRYVCRSGTFYYSDMHCKHGKHYCNYNNDIKLSEMRKPINKIHLNMLISTEEWVKILGNIVVNRACGNVNKNKINQLVMFSTHNVIGSFR